MGLGNNKEWSDTNRFSQTGYSASTIFPKKKYYTDPLKYEEDLKSANAREESHQEFLYDLKMEYQEDRCNCDYDDCDDDYCDDD